MEQSASAAHAYFMDPSLVDTMDDNWIGELDTEVNSQDHKLDDADPHFVAEFEKYEENNKSKSLLEDDGMDAKCQPIPSSQNKGMGDLWSYLIVGPIQKIKSQVVPKVEGIVGELVEEANGEKAGGIDKMVPVTLESIHFSGATLLLLAYGDNESREMENAGGHVKFQNNYNRVHVQLSGNCKMWRSDATSEDGGWLSTDVFVDTEEQKWHANLKVVNLFAPVCYTGI